MLMLADSHSGANGLPHVHADRGSYTGNDRSDRQAAL
jgi:hypothetical protein